MAEIWNASLHQQVDCYKQLEQVELTECSVILIKCKNIQLSLNIAHFNLYGNEYSAEFSVVVNRRLRRCYLQTC
jgi:hypothetical protein